MALTVLTMMIFYFMCCGKFKMLESIPKNKDGYTQIHDSLIDHQSKHKHTHNGSFNSQKFKNAGALDYAYGNHEAELRANMIHNSKLIIGVS
jgi:hypothetical protein